jgi:hypothetical protein
MVRELDPRAHAKGENVKGLEIEFTDGEKRVIEGNIRTHVKDNVLYVELKHESFGFAAWYEDRGSYPIVNVKSYHWIE